MYYIQLTGSTKNCASKCCKVSGSKDSNNCSSSYFGEASRGNGIVGVKIPGAEG
jgi:hypothetical protein